MSYHLSMFSVDVAVASSCKLGEGPAWDDRINSLYFVDIFGKKIFVYSPKSNTLDSFSTELTPGAVIPCTNRKLLLALEDGIYSCNADGTELERHHDIESEILGNRMNDAKCDRAGVLFGGTMGDGSTPSGNLYRITEREARRLRTGVTVSNGLAWSSDSKKMYYIDSALQSVLVADFDPETSSAHEFKEFITFPKEFGIPDGMCADLEDGIWVAFFGGRAVRRFNHLGKQTHVIEMPVSQVTSCAFSGEGSSILYITTASVDLGDGKELEKEAGHVFRVETGIAGQGTYAFKLK
jgi:sugar lactone lactonase YvrE